LIIQSDAFNRSKISTVVCLVITSNLKLAGAPGNVRISKGESRLPKESVINVSQVVTLDKSYLSDCLGAISNQLLRRVETGVKLVLGLE
jgi:mRNA interferase MazF